MAQDDLKKTSTAEDSTSETSRRRFLKAGAAVAVGAVATVAVPRAAEAGVKNADGTPVKEKQYSDDKLAAAITKAWTDESYKNRLLTRDYKVTSDALAEVGVNVAQYPNPVVLTLRQYNSGYTMRSLSEIVFVLPDPPASDTARRSADQAKSRMRVTPFGM